PEANLGVKRTRGFPASEVPLPIELMRSYQSAHDLLKTWSNCLRTEVKRRIGIRKAERSTSQTFDHQVRDFKPTQVVARPPYGRHRYAMSLQRVEERHLSQHISIATLPYSFGGYAHDQGFIFGLSDLMIIDPKAKTQSRVPGHDFDIAHHRIFSIMSDRKRLQLALQRIEFYSHQRNSCSINVVNTVQTIAECGRF